MLLTTTPTIQGQEIKEYLGIVTGETIIGANFMKDFLAGIRDIIGRTETSELNEQLRRRLEQMQGQREERAQQMGANAVVGIDLDYETVGAQGSMLMVTCSGTAVKI